MEDNDSEVELSEIDHVIDEFYEDEVVDLNDDQYNGSTGDDSVLTFTGHTAPVFCCKVDVGSENNKLALTGGEDDRAYVWDIISGGVLFEITGHKDSVTSIGFSHDGKFVATADMSGFIQVWAISSKEQVWSYETSDINWLKWHPKSHVLLVGSTEGDAYLSNVNSNQTKLLPGNGHSSDCGDFMPDGIRAVIGYGNGYMKIFDLKSGSCVFQLCCLENLLCCLQPSSDNALCAVGGAGCSTVLVNTHSGKSVCTLDCRVGNEAPGAEPDNVETLAFNSEGTLLSVGTLCGCLSIWDVATKIPRHGLKLSAGISKLVWGPSSHFVYIGCLDGVLRVLDSRSGMITQESFGHTNDILDVCVTMDEKHVLTSSDDHTCKVFSINQNS